MIEEALTAKQIAERICETSSPEAIKSLMYQIQHWDRSGVFDAIEMRVSEQHVGRGRSRQYPADTVYWCALLQWLSQQDIGVRRIIYLVTALSSKRQWEQKRGKADLLKSAINQEKTVFFIFDGTGSFALQEAPVSWSDSWIGGVYVNLTAIFSRVRV